MMIFLYKNHISSTQYYIFRLRRYSRIDKFVLYPNTPAADPDRYNVVPIHGDTHALPRCCRHRGDCGDMLH